MKSLAIMISLEITMDLVLNVLYPNFEISLYTSFYSELS